MNSRQIKRLKFKKAKYNLVIKEIRKLLEDNITAVVVDDEEGHIRDIKIILSKIKIAKQFKGKK